MYTKTSWSITWLQSQHLIMMFPSLVILCPERNRPETVRRHSTYRMEEVFGSTCYSVFQFRLARCHSHPATMEK